MQGQTEPEPMERENGVQFAVIAMVLTTNHEISDNKRSENPQRKLTSEYYIRIICMSVGHQGHGVQIFSVLSTSGGYGQE